MKAFSWLLLLAMPTALAAQTADENTRPKQERKVCKNQTDTHSRIARARICRTAAEWSAQRGQGYIEVPFDHSYKAQLGNGEGLKGPK